MLKKGFSIVYYWPFIATPLRVQNYKSALTIYSRNRHLEMDKKYPR